jgi:nitric oxide reductase large subunit
MLSSHVRATVSSHVVFPCRQIFSHASPLHLDLGDVGTTFVTDAALENFEWNLKSRVRHRQLLLDLLTWTNSSFELRDMNDRMYTTRFWQCQSIRHLADTSDYTIWSIVLVCQLLIGTESH